MEISISRWLIVAAFSCAGCTTGSQLAGGTPNSRTVSSDWTNWGNATMSTKTTRAKQAMAVKAASEVWPDSRPLSLKEFVTRIVGRQFTRTDIKSHLTIVRPGLNFLSDGTFQTSGRIVRYGIWRFEDGFANISMTDRNDKENQSWYFFVHADEMFLIDASRSNEIYQLNFEK